MSRPPCTKPIAPPRGGFELIAGWAIKIEHLNDLLNELGDNPNTVMFGEPAPEIDMLSYVYSKLATWEGPNKPECRLCWPLPYDDVPRWVVVSFLNMSYDGYLEFDAEGPLMPKLKGESRPERVDLFKETHALGVQDRMDKVLKHFFSKGNERVGKDTVKLRTFLDPKQAQDIPSAFWKIAGPPVESEVTLTES
ncbi:hypothetical protein EXIGLDRAFT_775184 [Exidia glandulosa HHB12029]|uniref:Uncharacterized protein n=1 Tax=Exidia glandulosa HHB12029 TaxID=1314781 RepID=A0A165E0P7_EXIGL|nr:hypothetical protein EXIGLDRAFT_775184 [Exidia glandulosa HHB12029]